MERILIIGISGGLGNLVANRLSEKYEIIGLDYRPYRRHWRYCGKFIQANYTQRTFNDLFHQYSVGKVVQLSKIYQNNVSREQNYFNLMAMRCLFDLCTRYEVETVIALSTFHVYGASSQNPVDITEEFPLRVAQNFPEILAGTEFDYLASSYLWKNQHTRTVVLRPCNIVGSHLQNTITKMLRGQFIPHLMGFDPMQQFIHESDFVHAIEIILDSPNVRGVYNIAGGGSIPTQEVIRLRNAKSLPIPHYFAEKLLHSLSLFGLGFPSYLVDYFRYPIIISDKKFREETGYSPKKNTFATLEEI